MRCHRRMNTTVTIGLRAIVLLAFAVPNTEASINDHEAEPSETALSLERGPLICVYNPEVGTVCAL